MHPLWTCYLTICLSLLSEVKLRAIPLKDPRENDKLDLNSDTSLPAVHELQQPLVHNIKDGKDSEDILPPDHVDGVRLEQDGHINHDFHKEVLLGNHEDLESRGPNETTKVLTAIFDRVDADSDGRIEPKELEDWIVVKIQEHYDEAVKANNDIFDSLDPDRNGFIGWTDYLKEFLIHKGFPADQADKYTYEYDSLQLPEEVKDKIVRFRFRWSEADDEPQDNRLSREEFLSFMHPEHSQKTIDSWVKDVLRGLDNNGDNIVTEAEFAALPEGQVDEQWEKADKDWQEERRKEFRRVIDLDGDGKVSIEELKHYVDPKNPNHAKAEAANLIELVDNDKDGNLSLEEVLAAREIILGSKMVDTGQSLHDEFWDVWNPQGNSCFR